MRDEQREEPGRVFARVAAAVDAPPRDRAHGGMQTKTLEPERGHLPQVVWAFTGGLFGLSDMLSVLHGGKPNISSAVPTSRPLKSILI